MAPTMMMQPPKTGMADSCPCMQMHQMMSGSPMGWVTMVLIAAVLLSVIAALVSASVFLVRRSTHRLGADA
jgi:hypothetical protein